MRALEEPIKETRRRDLSDNTLAAAFRLYAHFFKRNCERRLGNAGTFFLVLAMGQILACTIVPATLYAQNAASTPAATSPDEGKAIFIDWSRGTTILIDGMRAFLQTYRQKLAERLNVPLGELSETMAKQPSLARQNHRFVMDDYEAYAEKEALAANVDPRTVNPRVRAKFGELMVPTSDGNAEKLTDVLGQGRALRDKIFEAAYDATAKGAEPSSDVGVQTSMANYLQYRQRITQVIANDLKPQGTDAAGLNLEKILIFAFGVVFVVTVLVLAFVFPHPTSFQYTIVRIILALSTAAVGTLLTGFLTVQVADYIKAGGALAIFVIVYFWSPAALVTTPKDPLNK